MSFINTYEFKKCVNRYKGDWYSIKFTCRDQSMVMSFAQFTDRAGLRDIEITLNLCSLGVYRSGLKAIPESTSSAYNCEGTLYVEPKSSFHFKFYWLSPLQKRRY